MLNDVSRIVKFAQLITRASRTTSPPWTDLKVAVHRAKFRNRLRQGQAPLSQRRSQAARYELRNGTERHVCMSFLSPAARTAGNDLA